MATLLLVLFGIVAFITVLIFALSVARETGRLEERVDKLHQDAAINAQRAEIMVEGRTVDDTAKRLDDGTF